MRHRSRLAVLALGLTAVSLLSGCSFASTTPSVLETEREAEDEVPALEDESYDSIDIDSSRYVGEYEGVSLWIAKGVDSPFCLVAVTDPADDWMIGCGGLPTRISGSGHTFELHPADWDTPEGMTRVSDNVSAE